MLNISVFSQKDLGLELSLSLCTLLVSLALPGELESSGMLVIVSEHQSWKILLNRRS